MQSEIGREADQSGVRLVVLRALALAVIAGVLGALVFALCIGVANFQRIGV